MNLTTDVFLIGVIVATLAALVWSLYFVPRSFTQSFWWRLRQWVSMLLSVIMVLLSIFTLVNRANRWFTTTDALFQNPRTKVSPTIHPTAMPGEPRTPLVWNATPTQIQRDHRVIAELKNPIAKAHGGEWHSFQLAGSSGVTSRVLVWLPPSYLSDATRFHPVLFAFGGYPGDAIQWRDGLNLDQRLMRLAASSELRESIIVIPDVYPGQLDSECVDATTPDGKAWESWVVNDVARWVRHHLRVIEEPRAWAGVGFSAGGFCAAMIALRHPWLLGNAINLSGSWNPVLTKGQEWVRSDDPRYDLGAIARETAPSTGLYVSWGDGDTAIAEQAERFARNVRPPTHVTLAPVRSAAHTPEAWSTALDPSLRWLGHTSAYFAPR